MSASKPKSAGSQGANVSAIITRDPEGINPLTLPFPEWSDTDLNGEKWELPKLKLDKQPKTAKKGEEAIAFPSDFYEDPQNVPLPISIRDQVVAWKRPKELFPESVLVVYKESSEYSDLITGSKHLLRSDFMRSFISAIGTLEYLGFSRTVPIEFSTPNFLPLTENEPWRAWHHVYSGCKAGKGQKHKPITNQLGKYVIRIFWFGSWRKLIVDDTVPVGNDNELLLPSFKYGNNLQKTSISEEVSTSPSFKASTKKSQSGSEIELWPFLLCKALLKIACLSWTDRSELIDFDILSCLTGWFMEKIDLCKMDLMSKWDLCFKYTEHYQWPEMLSRPGSSKTTSKKNVPTTSTNSFYTVMAAITDIGELNQKELKEFAPCFGHSFLIDQVRDIPLEKPDPDKAIPLWKTYRWIDWAVEKGFMEPIDLEIKSVKIVSSFKKPIEDSIANEIQDEKPSKSDKSNKKPIKDVSFWLDFHRLHKFITHLYVFHKPSMYMQNIQISDIATKSKGPKTKSLENEPLINIVWSKDLMESRNDGLYLFLENVEETTLIFNLTQIGKRNNLIADATNLENQCNLVIEQYNWYDIKIGEISIILSTTGSKTRNLVLSSGRLILRLLIKSNISFILNILTTSFLTKIGNFEAVLPALAKESKILTYLCDRIANAFLNLITSFGTDLFSENLKKFYQSYIIDKNLSKNRTIHLHSLFLDEFVKIITESVPGFNFFLLKILLLNPLSRVKDEANFCDCMKLMEDEKAASRIQSFFKMIYVKKLFSYHDKNNGKFTMIQDGLKKLYVQLLEGNKRGVTCTRLMRNILFRYHELNDYRMYKDLLNIVDIYQYIGLVSSKENQWIVLTQQSFFGRELFAIKIKIAFFCELSKYIVRVYDNDTLNEIERFSNNVNVHDYQPNINGYTILVYGWSKKSESINWKIDLITIKGNNPSIQILPQIYLNSNNLIDNYIPNIHNIICKSLIIVQEDAIVTLRLSVNYPDVKLKLRCLSKNGEILREIYGTGSIILPLVSLKKLIQEPEVSKSSLISSSKKRSNSATSKSRDSNRSSISLTKKSRGSSNLNFSTIYAIEGYVLDDSWPLLQEEWNVVEDVKAKNLITRSQMQIFGSDETIKSSQRKFSKRRSTYHAERMLSPFWCLEAVYDKNFSINMEINKQRQEEIRMIKIGWYKNDINRLERSILLRENYLENRYIKWEDSSRSLNELSSISKEDSECNCICTCSEEMKSKSLIALESISNLKENQSRTLKKVVSRTKILPDFNLEDWPWKEECGETLLKTPENEEYLNQIREDVVNKFNEEQEEFTKSITLYLEDRENRNKLLGQFFDSCRKDSVEMMKQAYDLRETCKKNRKLK